MPSIGVMQILAAVLVCTLVAGAQGQAGNQAPYTLHTGTRIVLTDVTVTDRDGNPVRGLTESDFRIFDDNRPQRLNSFTEHTPAEDTALPPQAAAPGSASNGFLQNPPAALDVLLLDTTTIGMTDQMYLAEQLGKFLDTLPPNHLLAVYTRAGDSVVELQSFTSDRNLLRQAVRRAVPVFRQPGSWAANDLDTLVQITSLLRPYPGRKNLIWFSGGSNAALMVDAGELPSFINMQPIYDALESSRIAVYPVDARGLTVTEFGAMPYQHILMSDTADATGGHAFVNTNGLGAAATQIVNDGSSFYTLTYSPSEERFDNRWHKVRVELETKGYQLSYRHGYYDDGSNLESASAASRQRLGPGGTTSAQAGMVSQPLLFSARVLPASELPPAPGNPAPPSKKQTAYAVEYTMPARELAQKVDQGKPVVQVAVMVLAVDRLGNRRAKEAESLRITLNPAQLQANPNGVVAFDQQVNLPKGDNFLYVAVEDEGSGRSGMVQLPVAVPKPGKQ